MDDTQKTRLIFLVVCAVCLGGVVAGYFWWQNQKTQEADGDMPVVQSKAPKLTGPRLTTQAPPPVKPGISQGPVATATPAQPAKSNLPPQPGLPPIANAPQPRQAQPPVAVVAQQPVKPAQPPVATATPAQQIRPNPSPNLPPVAGQAPKSNLPPVAGAPVQAPKSNLPPVAGQAPKSNLPPVAGQAPKSNLPPVAGQAPKSNLPPVANTPSPGMQPKPGMPPKSGIAAMIAETTPQAVAQPPAQVAPPVAKTDPGKTPATIIAVAQGEARKGSGKSDPMVPVTSFARWPKFQQDKEDQDMVPPPPANDSSAAKPEASKIASNGKTEANGKHRLPPAPKLTDKLVPPPPPTTPSPGTVADGSLGGLPIDQLPTPPAKPTIGDKLRVLAVMDDKAIFSFPAAMRLKNRWPKTLTLGPGQQFESINVVSVSKDSVTIEEDGERTTLNLPTVK